MQVLLAPWLESDPRALFATSPSHLMGNPLVSVLTPSFNQGRFLSDCIGSVRNQTYPAVEHVICDGGSTDETLRVLRAASSNVRWVSEPDRGQAHAINKAFAMSKGDFVGWLNSDDAYYDRHAIEDAVSIFRRRPEIDVVYGHAALVGADNELLHFMWAPRFSARLLRYANFIVQPTVLLRRRALGDLLIDDQLDFAVDRELWLRLMYEGRRFARLDRVVAIDRHHELRKVYTLQDIGEEEVDRLDAKYGVPGGMRRAWISRAFRIAARIWGARLLTQAVADTALAVHFASGPTLLRRQLLTRRKDMPMLRG